MKRLTLILCTFGLGLPLVQGYMSGPGPGPGEPPPPPPPGDSFVPPEWDVPPEILELRTALHAARTALEADRAELLATLAAQGATFEEVKAALEQWRTENADAIANIQELAAQLRTLIEENRPDMGIELPPEIIALRDQLRTVRQELAESRRAAIDAVENPTPEAIRAALEAWRTENAEQIALARSLAEQIRTWFQANRPPRPMPYMPGDMLQRRIQFRENLQEMRQLREQLMDPTLTEEEIAAIREQQRQLLQERRMLMRHKRTDEGGVGGDRRPGG